MRIAFTTLTFLLFSFWISAQPDPVAWSFSLDTAENGRLQVKATAQIEHGWKLYAHQIDDGGPIPTNLVIDENDGLTADGNIDEAGNMHGPETDEIFDMSVSYFTGDAVFTRAFDHKKSASVKGYVEYMVCDEHRCLPPKEVTFDLEL